MAILIKGTTYATGSQVTATNLNAHVDSATFDTGAVDNSTTQLSSGAIIVKDGGISSAKLATNIAISGTFSVTGITTIAAGTVSLPAAIHTGDPDSGYYWIGANNLGVACAGAKVLDIGTAGLGVTGTFTATSSIKSSSATTGIGYATGAGGTVTQITSKTTSVTLNKVCGQITMTNTAMAAAAEVSFTVTNSAMAVTDIVIVNHVSGGTLGAYLAQANSNAAGSFKITVTNVSTGTLSDAIVLGFVIIKGVTS